MAGQFTFTREFPFLGLHWWMRLARTSFPVPVSPCRRTVLAVGATWAARLQRRLEGRAPPDDVLHSAWNLHLCAEVSGLGLQMFLELLDLFEVLAEGLLGLLPVDDVGEDLPDCAGPLDRPVGPRDRGIYGVERERAGDLPTEPEGHREDRLDAHAATKDPLRFAFWGEIFKDVREADDFSTGNGPVIPGVEQRSYRFWRARDDSRAGPVNEEGENLGSLLELGQQDSLHSEVGRNLLQCPSDLGYQ